MAGTEEYERANRAAPVPPGYKDGRVRTIEWEARGKTLQTVIERGRPVHTQLHAVYWAELETYRDMLAQAEKVGMTLSTFVLMESRTVIGSGSLDLGDGAEEIAWLSCFFVEMSNNRMSMRFALPSDCAIDFSSVTGDTGSISINVPNWNQVEADWRER